MRKGKMFFWVILLTMGTMILVSCSLRWLAKPFNMPSQAWFPLGFIIGVAIQDAVMGHDPAVHFVEPDFVPIFDWMIFFAPTNDVGMWLENA